MAAIDASTSSSASIGSIPRAAARTSGCSSARSAAGTPTNSPITAIGKGSAKSRMNSTCPPGQVLEQVAHQRVHGGAESLDLAGVNERETSRRRRVWSGGSAKSMLCEPASKNWPRRPPLSPKTPVDVSSMPTPRPNRGSRRTAWHSS